MMKKTILFGLIVISMFLIGCSGEVSTIEKKVDNQQKATDLLEYENKDLGISFKYPSDFKVSLKESFGDYIEIDSGYSINYEGYNTPLYMSIGKKMAVSGERESLEDVKKWVNDMGLSILSIENKEGYDIIKIASRDYYLLTDKGSLVISDNVNEANEPYITKEEFIKYQNMFDGIMESIKII